MDSAVNLAPVRTTTVLRLWRLLVPYSIIVAIPAAIGGLQAMAPGQRPLGKLALASIALALVMYRP
jgi:hypothetical protein